MCSQYALCDLSLSTILLMQISVPVHLLHRGKAALAGAIAWGLGGAVPEPLASTSTWISGGGRLCRNTFRFCVRWSSNASVACPLKMVLELGNFKRS